MAMPRRRSNSGPESAVQTAISRTAHWAQSWDAASIAAPVSGRGEAFPTTNFIQGSWEVLRFASSGLTPVKSRHGPAANLPDYPYHFLKMKQAAAQMKANPTR